MAIALGRVGRNATSGGCAVVAAVHLGHIAWRPLHPVPTLTALALPTSGACATSRFGRPVSGISTATQSGRDAVNFPRQHLLVDGVTPVHGLVQSVCDFGTLISLGGGYQGLVPSDELTERGLAGTTSAIPFRHGDAVIVYVVGRNDDTGKIKLSLQPLNEPLNNRHRLVCDGRHPYSGVVKSMAKYGAFVDIGFHRPGLLPTASLPARQTASMLQVGDKLTVYVTRIDAKTGRFSLALDPCRRALIGFEAVVADGQTPYQGTVMGRHGEGVLIDIGCEMMAWMAASCEDMPELSFGSTHAVFVVNKARSSRRLYVSLRRRTKPLSRMQDVVADGQTPYQGTLFGAVRNGGHWLVDIGCEELAFLPASDPLLLGGCPSSGNAVTVYVTTKQKFAGKLVATSVRRSSPLERITACIADGCTPYAGIVLEHTPVGTFVDIGCNVMGMLPVHSSTNRSASIPTSSRLETATLPVGPSELLPMGSSVTVFIWYHNHRAGKIHLGMRPRATPGRRLEDIPADGTTPIDGRVVAQSAMGIYIDIGCDQLACLKRCEQGFDIESVSGLSRGDEIRVYVRRKNLALRKVSLSLIPEERPRLRLTEIQGDGIAKYPGVICSIAYGQVFVDFQCEVTGWLAEEDIARHSLEVGENVWVRPLTFDVEAGRWHVALDIDTPFASEFCELDAGAQDHLTPMSSMPRDALALVQAGDLELMGALKPTNPALPSPVNASQISGTTISIVGKTERELARAAPAPPPLPPLQIPASDSLCNMVPQPRVNHKGLLQNAMQSRTRRNVTREDIRYEARISHCGGWLASVRVRMPPPGGVAGGFVQEMVFEGELRNRKTDAEHSAAARALADLGSPRESS